MALIYITGAPGTGKTTIEQQLNKLGFTTYDADSIGGAYNTRTSRLTNVPPASERSPEWFADHQWRIPRDRVVELARQATDSPVIICGTTSNDNEFSDLLDQIIVLDVDEATLLKRIGARQDNDYGKNPHELADIIRKHRHFAHQYISPKVSHIDASQPVEAVVASIIKEIQPA